MKYKKIIFKTPAETLQNLNLTYRLSGVLDEVNIINQILAENFTEFNGGCRCGSINQETSELVILVNNNGTFYKFNQQVENFRDILVQNCRFYDRILVKVSPIHTHKATQNKAHYLDEQQIKSWNKIAESLGRPPIEDNKQESNDEIVEPQWHINL